MQPWMIDMNLTRTEMSLLCKIAGIQALASFATFEPLKREKIDEAKQGLEEKELMINGTFTEKGLSVTRIVDLFSQATFLLKLGKATFARYEEHEYVMLSEEDEVFELGMVTQDEITVIVLSKLKQLSEVEDDKYRRKFIKKSEFDVFMKENSDIEAIFYRSIDLVEKKETTAAFFINNGYLNLYDVGKEQMDCFPKRKVQSGIETMFH